jgi:hypothetical protein
MPSALHGAIMLLAAVVSIAPNAMAHSPSDARVVARPVPIAATAEDGRNAYRRCSGACPARLTGHPSAAADIPAPTHLPVASSPDEIASWHAEIFARLTQAGEDGSLCGPRI